MGGLRLDRLPTVMYGGYALLGLLTRPDGLTPFQRTWFRAGHAHAGILLLMFLVFIDYLTRPELSGVARHAACAIFVAGTLAQSGGFFVHISRGREEASSVGTTLTSVGAILLTVAIAILVYGIWTTG